MPAISPAKSVLPAPSNVHLVALSAIDVKPQVRTTFGKQGIAGLAESIKANGLLQPVLLRPGKKAGRYELIAGERRVRAAKVAGLTHVPALSGQADDRAKLRMQLAENLDREDLEEREVCAAVKALFDQEKDLAKVAAIVKRSKPWVSKYLAASTSWEWDTRRLLEAGATEDMEVLGAFNQLAKLSRWNGTQPVVDRREVEKVAREIKAGKVGREEIREIVAAAKAKGAEREAKAKKKSKGSKAAREPKARKLKPEQLAQRLFDAALGFGVGGDYRQECKEHEPTEIAAAEATLRASYDAGVVAAGPVESTCEARYAVLYNALLGWRHSSSKEAWLAGFVGIPFSLEGICQAVEAAGKLADELVELDDQGARDKAK